MKTYVVWSSVVISLMDPWNEEVIKEGVGLAWMCLKPGAAQEAPTGGPDFVLKRFLADLVRLGGFEVFGRILGFQSQVRGALAYTSEYCWSLWGSICNWDYTWVSRAKLWRADGQRGGNVNLADRLDLFSCDWGRGYLRNLGDLPSEHCVIECCVRWELGRRGAIEGNNLFPHWGKNVCITLNVRMGWWRNKGN